MGVEIRVWELKWQQRWHISCIMVALYEGAGVEIKQQNFTANWQIVALYMGVGIEITHALCVGCGN